MYTPHQLLLDYLLHDKDNVVYMPLKGNIGNQYETFKNELLQETSIRSISAKNSHPLLESDYTTDIEWPGKDPTQKIIMEATGVDYDYLTTIQLEMKEGRSFSREYKTDIGGAYILNEEAVKLMGLESPLGKEIAVWHKKGIVIGVVTLRTWLPRKRSSTSRQRSQPFSC